MLISVYHGDDAEYFATAMDSLLAQTVPSDDIVLTIDGPLPAALREVVERYLADNRQLRPIWFAENVGLGAVRAVALPECRHELVMIMDSDDISAPNRAEVLLAFLAEHPDIDVVSTTLTEFVGAPENIVAVKRVPLKDAEIRKRARRWNPINHAAAMFRKSAILAVGGYQDFPRHEDYYLWVRLLMAGYQAAAIDEPLLNVRISPENLERRRSAAATNAAIKFHLWKHKVGFAGWFSTAWMIAFMCAIRLVPGPIYRLVYRLKRH